MKQPKVLFLTLACFSLTGGIEKVCRALAKALNPASVLSLVDAKPDLDQRYLNPGQFKGFENKKFAFLWGSLQRGLQSDLVLLSHINLLPAAKLIKWFRPQTRFILLAHGIEVWRPLKPWKTKFLKGIEIWAVSAFTKMQLVKLHGLDPQRITVQHNCLDPYFEVPVHLAKPAYLSERYQIQADQKVIFSLCRLANEEAYKGYDLVIQTMPTLLEKYSNLVYLLGGKADQAEQNRIQELVNQLNLNQHVKLLGFVSDDELQDHFMLADVFVLPSHEEGFGIVFIESAACGCVPLAGNKDGSVDALLNGALGTLVNPFNQQDIEKHLDQLLAHTETQEQKKQRQVLCLQHFVFEQYQQSVLLKLNSSPFVPTESLWERGQGEVL